MSGSLGALLTPKWDGESTARLNSGPQFPKLPGIHLSSSLLGCPQLTKLPMFTIDQARRRVQNENKQPLKEKAGGAEPSGRQWGPGGGGAWVGTWVARTKYQETNMKSDRLAVNQGRVEGMLTAQRSIGL